MVHPIADKYYDRNPHHRRSAAYVQAKGLAANEKTAATRGATPLTTPSPSPDQEVLKRLLVPTIPFGNTRSRTPETASSSTIPRMRTALSFSETSSQSDVRGIAAPPARPTTTLVPSQGNIKKKRASLGGLDIGHADMDQAGPLTPEPPPRTEYGNPNKIAQFFPELNLA